MFQIRFICWGLMTASLLLVVPGAALGFAGFLSDWRDTYPDSSSGNINCQLCHGEPTGGQPWNSYGFAVRFRYQNNGFDIVNAFREVEAANSDGSGGTNLEEINAGSQPGWEVGPVNTLFFASGFTQTNQPAPPTLDPFPEALPVLSLGVVLEEVATGFTAPLDGRFAPVAGLEEQLFIADQIGLVWRLDLETGEQSLFLDFKERPVNPLGIQFPGGYDERGLLGLVFHPDYASNGRLYIYVSEPSSGDADFSTMPTGVAANHQGVLTEITISNQSATSGPGVVVGERELLRIDQPQFNHNGGGLLFDADGYLLVSLGDGGGRDDEGPGHGAEGNGSDPANPLGSILRIDPLDTSGGSPYGIPADNPFVDDLDIPSEVFAYGFRNPWRISLDGDTVYVADVGQDQVEEISILSPGDNHGWRFKEGSFFFDPNDALPGIVTTEEPAGLPSGLIEPLFEYDHGEGISVTGGAIYRGAEIPALRGRYVYGDFLRRLMVGDPATGEVSALDTSVDFFVFGFATDANGEMYALGQRAAGFPGTIGTDGVVAKLTSSAVEEFCFPVKRPGRRVKMLCL